MKGSLIAVLFFAIGLTAGHCDYLPTWTTDSRISFVALCGLLLFPDFVTQKTRIL